MKLTALITFLVVWGVVSVVVQRRLRRSAKALADGLLTMRRRTVTHNIPLPAKPLDEIYRA